MKKIIAVFLALLMIASLAACSSEKEKSEHEISGSETTEPDFIADMDISSDAKKFFNCIADGEYQKAIDLYNNSLLGNSQKEAEAKTICAEYYKNINNKFLNGTMTEQSAEAEVNTIHRVAQGTYIDYGEENDELFTQISESKKNYALGCNAYDTQNYDKAYEYLKLVMEDDCNYSDAQTKLAQAIADYKNKSLADAKSKADEGNYPEACKILTDSKNLLADDVDIQSAYDNYENIYVTETLTNAEALFIEPATDYVKALELVNTAIQFFPENADLTAKKDYYLTFAPVNLFDMDKMKGNADRKESDTDIYGNSYEKCFWAGYSSAIWNDTDITYNLNNSYNTFDATVYCRSKKNEAQIMSIEIYADNQLVYEKLDIADNGTQPYSINLDVTGVSELRIVLGRTDGEIGSGIGLTDMFIQKTVK